MFLKTGLLKIGEKVTERVAVGVDKKHTIPSSNDETYIYYLIDDCVALPRLVKQKGHQSARAMTPSNIAYCTNVLKVLFTVGFCLCGDLLVPV